MKGMKIRVMQSPGYVKAYEAFGAQPTPMAYGDVYMALQQGVVDGADTSPDQFVMDKFIEVSKYYNITKRALPAGAADRRQAVLGQAERRAQEDPAGSRQRGPDREPRLLPKSYDDSIVSMKKAGVQVVEANAGDLKQTSSKVNDAAAVPDSRRQGAVQQGRRSQEGGEVSMAKRPHMDLYAVGDHAEFAKTVTDFDVYGFAGIVGDFYGVHVNEEYAKKTRFERRIAQGALSVGFLATVMGYMAAKAPNPGAVSYRYDITFTGAGVHRRHRHREAGAGPQGRGPQHLRVRRHRHQPGRRRRRAGTDLPQGAVNRMSTSPPRLLEDSSGRIRWITVNRPNKHNAFAPGLLAELGQRAGPCAGRGRRGGCRRHRRGLQGLRRRQRRRGPGRHGHGGRLPRHGGRPPPDAAPARVPQAHGGRGERLCAGRRLRAGAGVRLHRRRRHREVRLSGDRAEHDAGLGRHPARGEEDGTRTRQGDGAQRAPLPRGRVPPLRLHLARGRTGRAARRGAGVRGVAGGAPPVRGGDGQAGRQPRRRDAAGRPAWNSRPPPMSVNFGTPHAREGFRRFLEK